MLVETKTTGRVVTRNGEYDISSIKAELLKGGKVRLGFVSSLLHRSLHAGATIDAAAMDELASKWVEKRGLVDRWPGLPPWAMERLQEAQMALAKLEKELGG